MIVFAPFTEDQVKSLNEFQSLCWWHPFTCGENHAEDNILVATESGWICPSCDYTQDWAHGFMADWSWEEVGKATRRVLYGDSSNHKP